MPSDPASHPTHSTAWKQDNEVGEHEPLTWSSPESDAMSNRGGQRDVNTGDTSGREDRSYSYDGDDSLRKLLTEEEIDAILETTTISDYTPSEMRELSLEGEGVVRAFKAAHQQLDDSPRGVEPGTTQRRAVIIRRAGEGHTSSGPRSFEVAARHYPNRNSLKAATGIPTTVKSQSRFQSPSSSSMSTTVSRSPMFPSQPIPTLAPPRPPLPPPNHCISIANVALVSQARRQR